MDSKSLTLEAILNTTVDGIIIIDSSGIITLVNPAVERIFEYNKEELIDKNISILMPEPDHSQHNQYISNFLRTGKKKIIGIGREVKGRKKSGEQFPFKLSVSQLNVDGEVFFTGVVHDISEQKNIQAQLEQLNSELEQRVEERTKQVQEALDKEKQLSEMKSRFVSMASHEFRTPLGTILSSASLIERYNTPETEERRLKHVERIKSSVKNLTNILDDFLSIDKLETGRLQIKPSLIDVEQITQSIIDDISSIAKKGQQLHYGHFGEKEIHIDEHIYKNILINLLSNAIKYSLEDKRIDIKTEIGGDEVKLVVKDNGIGIPEEEKDLMFERFFRAKNVTNIQGTGLGLNIVKKYLDFMNGAIYFDSELNKGTTFTVVIPEKYTNE